MEKETLVFATNINGIGASGLVYIETAKLFCICTEKVANEILASNEHNKALLEQNERLGESYADVVRLSMDKVNELESKLSVAEKALEENIEVLENFKIDVNDLVLMESVYIRIRKCKEALSLIKTK